MDQLSKEEIHRSVEVLNLPEDIDQDDLFGHFENHRFGGGEIEKLQLRTDDTNLTLITFRDESVVDNLLKRQNEKRFRISGMEIDLRRCKVPKPKPVQVFGKEVMVSGIPADLDEDDLISILENRRKGGGTVENVTPTKFIGTSLATYSDQSVAERLVENGEMSLGKVTLKITWPLRLGNDLIFPDEPEEERVCPNLIVIENCTKDQLDHVLLNLESKRQNGGKLEFIQMESDDTAVAKFVDESVATRFLEQGVIKISGVSFPIRRPSLPSDRGKKGHATSRSTLDFPNTIEVSGISEKMSEDFLRMYFENSRRSGGGEIKAINFIAEEGVATITFSDPKAVHRILDKGEHKIGSEVPIQVIALESLTPDLIDQVCAIRVTNIPPNMSRDLIEYHFESEKRSGGDEFEEVIHDRDDGSAIFTFKSPEIRRRVLSRPHVLESVQLTVEALQPSPPPPVIVGKAEEKKLLFGNLPTDLNEDGLKMFVEKAAGCQVTGFTYGLLPDVVLLDFRNVPEYSALRKLVVAKPFQGQMISVQKVKPSSSVIIRGAKSLSDDIITLHFENNRRSGGGDVKRVQRNDDGDVIIEFADRAVIQSVLKKKQEIDNCSLKMSLYDNCLFEGTGNNFRRTKIKIPDELTIPVDELILQYLSKYGSFRDKMETEMWQFNCAVQWQMPVKLTCTLTPKSKNFAKLVANWESLCTEKFNALLDRILVKDEKLSSEIWSDFRKQMTGIEQKGVICEFDDNSFSLRVTGNDEEVSLYMKTMSEIRNKLQAELAKRKKKTFKSISNLRPNKLRLLKVLKLCDSKFSKDVAIKVDDQQVSFEGSEEDVTHAMITIYELVNKMQSRQFSNFEPLKVKFLQKKEVTDHLRDLFEKLNMKVVWNLDNNHLEILGMSVADVDKSFSLIDAEILIRNVTLDVNQVVTMRDAKWNDFKKKIKDAFKIVDMQFDQQSSTILVFSHKAVIDLIIQELDEFLNLNTILEKFIQLENGKVTYIEHFKSQEITSLEKQLGTENVVIELMQEKDASGISVRGTKTGLAAAVAGLNDIHQHILSTDFESDTFVTPRFFSSVRGKEALEKIQAKNKVIVEVSRQLKRSGAAKDNDGKQLGDVSKGPILKSTVNIKNSVVKVLKGNLIDCQAKVFVVPIKNDLKHKDGVARAIVEAGGQTIEDECQAHVKTSGKLLTGQIYTSKPGKLTCSAVIHLALPKWKEGKEKEVDCLYDGIWSSLLEATNKGWPCIAISGSSSFPASTAAKVVVEAIDEFISKRSSLEIQISLIDLSDQVVNHFHEALTGMYGREVKINDENNSLSLTSSSPNNIGSPPQMIKTKYQQGKDAMTLVTPEGVNVTLIQGPIAAQQADVIMNTASKELNLSQGAVSSSINHVAGANLQIECKNKAPNGLKAGEMITTSGYNLKCKFVYHGACDSWDGGKGASKKIIQDLLKKVFLTAHQARMTSIAIPALGTGNLGFPKEVVCAVMYEEAENFSRDNPATTVKDLRFVVFDDPTVKVFKEYVGRLTNPHALLADQAAATIDRKRSRNLLAEEKENPKTKAKTGSVAKGASGGQSIADDFRHLDDDIDLNSVTKTIKIKSLVMKIKQGDITKENTDVIVNSTNKDLNLSGGAVTKAILAAGGQSIADDCKRLGKTNRDGIAVTSSGRLKCKSIIHVAAPDTSFGTAPDGKTWEQRILSCLSEAENMKFSSITFPLLGTGLLNTSPADIAVHMLNAVGKFAVSFAPKHLKAVCICIFQPKMVDEFFTAISKKLSENKPGLWGKFTGWLSSLVTSDSKDGGYENFEIIDDILSPLKDYQTIFKIFGLSQKIIDKAIAEIEELMKSAVTDKVLDTPDIQESVAKLTKEQIKRIENDAAEHQVRATIEQGQKLKRIRLQGDATDIADVTVNVMRILREIEVNALKRNEAERIAELARWEYKEEGGGFESYPPDINVIIEQAFRNKIGYAKWEEADGSFMIDFKTNTEEDLTTKKKTTIRRIGDAPIEEPKHWEQMNPGENYRLVHVPVGSTEYNDVETKIKASCQQSCKEIIKIERIQNHVLYQQYAVKKFNMEASAGAGTVIERILWHGTSEDTVKQVNAHGFNRSYCGKNATAYGQGVYFARDWTYSAHATYSPPNSQGFKFIYHSRVLTGEFTTGNQAFIDTPLKPNQTVERYDSVVDNMANSTIFVIFRDAQAYPEYLITFMV